MSNLKHQTLDELELNKKECIRYIGNLKNKLNQQEIRLRWINHYIENKDTEMTKSNNEGVLKIGDACLFFGPIESAPLKTREARITALGDLMALIVVDGKEMSCRQSQLSPIKTEAEKRREERLLELAEDYYGDKALISADYENDKHLNWVINRGWIKPKPLTDEVVKKLWLSSAGKLDIYHAFAEAIEAYIRGEIK